MAGTITDDDAFLARAGRDRRARARRFTEHRRHPALIFLWLPSDELRVAPLQRRLEPERRAWRRVVREVLAEDARGIVFAGEGWAEDDTGDLAESLIVSALTRSGRSRTETTPFTRTRGRRIELHEGRVLEEPGPSSTACARRGPARAPTTTDVRKSRPTSVVSSACAEAMPPV